jgi:uncharacterized protein
MGAFIIDAFAFCKKGERHEGEIAVAELSRLAAETIDQAGTVKWSLAGSLNSFGHAQLQLSVSGQVNLVCQRCLSGLLHHIDSQSVIVLAKDEDDADEVESLLDDDAIDVIVGSTAFDAQYLIEDDALLALPLAPKHSVCPDAKVSGTAEGNVVRPSPFAMLKDIKTKQ